MPAIIALALIALVALTVLSFAVHVLLSPWLLVAIAILAWVKFRPRPSTGSPSAWPPAARPAQSRPPGGVVLAEQSPGAGVPGAGPALLSRGDAAGGRLPDLGGETVLRCGAPQVVVPDPDEVFMRVHGGSFS